MMKRIIVVALVVVMLVISGIAFADGIESIIPSDSMWGISQEDFKTANEADCVECSIGKNSGLLVPDIEIDSYVMDCYYVFGEMIKDSTGKYYNGLSKVAFIWKGKEKRSGDELKQCYITLIEDMTTAIGEPDTVEKAKTTWNRDYYNIEIGKGKFEKYTGSDNSKIAIVITGIGIEDLLNSTPMPTPIPTPTPTPTPTPIPTPTPTPKPKLVSSIDNAVAVFPFSNATAFESLSKGCKGEEVRELNRKLASMGWPCGLGDEFDDDTEEGVKAYQQYNGLDVTGVVDKATYESIFGVVLNDETDDDNEDSIVAFSDDGISQAQMDDQVQNCFKIYRTCLKNPYSATLQEYQHYSSLENSNYEYYLVAITAQNGIGAEIASSFFSVYDVSTDGVSIVAFNDYFFDGSVISHVNGMYSQIITLNNGGNSTIVRSNSNLSNKDIATCLSEFYHAWAK